MFNYYVIDFDSTFVTVESLDELAKIALHNTPDKEIISAQIVKITNLGMEGKLPFHHSLEQRLKLFKPSKKHINQVVNFLRKSISKSVVKNKDFFLKNKDSIYIISGGFEEYIIPVVSDFGILANHVLANQFIYNGDQVIGFQKSNHLAKPKGKVNAVKSLKLSGTICVIGDGYTDYEIKKEGEAHSFIAFTENVKRPNIIALADKVVTSFDEIIHE